MKYLCRHKTDGDYLGFGDTPEKAFEDFSSSYGDFFNVEKLDWYELNPIKATMAISVSKQITKKATK